MRAVLAAALGLLLLVAMAAPHVHVGAQGAEECAVCAASGRGAEAATDATPVVVPGKRAQGPATHDPGLPPVAGAPRGAVPGQSPPAA